MLEVNHSILHVSQEPLFMIFHLVFQAPSVCYCSLYIFLHNICWLGTRAAFDTKTSFGLRFIFELPVFNGCLGACSLSDCVCALGIRLPTELSAIDSAIFHLRLVYVTKAGGSEIQFIDSIYWNYDR